MSLANFGLMTTLIPVPIVIALMNARAGFLQRHQETLLSQLYFALAFCSVVSVVGGVQFVRKALIIRKFGLDHSCAAKAPRMIRCLAWLTAIAFCGMIVFYCVNMRSALLWLLSAYLLASVLGLAVTADFATRSAMTSSVAAERDIG